MVCYIGLHINHRNIAWASTIRTKLDKILKKQKHGVRIIYNKDKFAHSKSQMRDMNALNVYQINIFQFLKCLYKARHNLNRRVFNNAFTEIHHRYPTMFSRNNFKQPKIITKATSFVISSRESKILSNYLHEFEKTILFSPLFLNKLENKLLESEDKAKYFSNKVNCNLSQRYKSTYFSVQVLYLMRFVRTGMFKYECTFK